jgi:hypothetical protein
MQAEAGPLPSLCQLTRPMYQINLKSQAVKSKKKRQPSQIVLDTTHTELVETSAVNSFKPPKESTPFFNFLNSHSSVRQIVDLGHIILANTAEGPLELR